MVSEDSTCTAAREASSTAYALSAESRGVPCAAKLSRLHEVERKRKNDFVPIRTPENPAPRRTHNTPA